MIYLIFGIITGMASLFALYQTIREDWENNRSRAIKDVIAFTLLTVLTIFLIFKYSNSSNSSEGEITRNSDKTNEVITETINIDSLIQAKQKELDKNNVNNGSEYIVFKIIQEQKGWKDKVSGFEIGLDKVYPQSTWGFDRTTFSGSIRYGERSLSFGKSPNFTEIGKSYLFVKDSIKYSAQISEMNADLDYIVVSVYSE